MDIIDFFTDVEKNDMQYLLTNPRAKYTAKKEKLISAWIQASKKMWKEYGRSLTEEEKQEVLRKAKHDFNNEVRQSRMTKTINKVAITAL